MKIFLKIFFIIFSCLKNELLLDDQNLNLIDDDYLLDNQEDKFETGRLRQSLKNSK